MLSFRGRTVYILWVEQEEGDDQPSGFDVIRLLADSSLSTPPGAPDRTTDLRAATEHAFMVLGVPPFAGEDERFWEDVAGTDLDTRTLTVQHI
jgi:hypothetical protein